MVGPYNIIKLDTIDSTNNEAKRRLSEIGNFTVISARNQTLGRGQRGNIWKSNHDENLLFSVVLKFNDVESCLQIPASSQMALSCITALTVIKTLESLNVEAKIKWPNDIYIGDKKVCSILIENSVNGATLSSSIIGVGINVNQTDFDDDIPNPISISQCIGSVLSTEAILSVFLNIFEDYLIQFTSGEVNYKWLRELYAEYLWRLNAITEFVDKRSLTENLFIGKIRGILPNGKLLIDSKGEILEFGFNEVSYLRPVYKIY